MKVNFVSIFSHIAATCQVTERMFFYYIFPFNSGNVCRYYKNSSQGIYMNFSPFLVVVYFNGITKLIIC